MAPAVHSPSAAGNIREMLDGKYANYFQIGENALEFIVEFGQLYSDEPAPADSHSNHHQSRVCGTTSGPA